MNFDSKVEPISAEFLIEKGFCCGNRCQNCPYWPKYIKDNVKLKNKNDPISETPTTP